MWRLTECQKRSICFHTSMFLTISISMFLTTPRIVFGMACMQSWL